MSDSTAPPTSNRRPLDRVLVPLAHGFGLGLIKPAPGTWGSLLGLPIAAFLGQQTPAIGWAIWIVMFLIGVVTCDAAARHFARKDPGECVIDEYVAIPMIALIIPMGWTTLLLTFGLFRLFDIWKPWPIKAVEKIPGGWGVMADDIVAAGYAAGVLALLLNLAK